MTPEQFVYWLQGYFEINAAVSGHSGLTSKQGDVIKEHLAKVLVHAPAPAAQPYPNVQSWPPPKDWPIEWTEPLPTETVSISPIEIILQQKGVKETRFC